MQVDYSGVLSRDRAYRPLGPAVKKIDEQSIGFRGSLAAGIECAQLSADDGLHGQCLPPGFPKEARVTFPLPRSELELDRQPQKDAQRVAWPASRAALVFLIKFILTMGFLP
jgi:hypothetical protein